MSVSEDAPGRDPYPYDANAPRPDIFGWLNGWDRSSHWNDSEKLALVVLAGAFGATAWAILHYVVGVN